MIPRHASGSAKRALLFALVFGTAASCATPVARRSYQRSDLGQLHIARLDLAVIVAPPAQTGDELDVEPFRSLVSESALLDRPVDAIETAAVAAQVKAEVLRRQFTVHRLLTPGVGLDAETRVDSLVRTSTADAVLILRAVPIDSFSLIEPGRDMTSVHLGLGVLQTATPPKAHRGRLYLGQVFLFAAGNGLRLASRQAPDYPDGGRLTYGHPFLEFGIVLKDETPELTQQLVALAAQRFVARLLEELPEAKAGAPGELQSLTAAADDDGPLQVFLDESHLSLELNVQHRIESLEVPVQLGGQAVAALKAGDFAPAGIFQILPRATFWSPNGMSFGISLPLGFASQDLGRTLFLDGEGGADPTVQRLEVAGLKLVGVVLETNLIVPLTRSRPTVFLLPRAFFSTEFWLLDGAGSETRTRSGLGAGADLLYRPGDGPVFVRLGLEARLGLDFAQGGLFGGFASTVGTGWLF